MSCVAVSLGPACVDISGVRGGDRNLMTMNLMAGGAPLDLTGMTVEAEARANPTAIESITAVVEIVDAEAGQISIRWPGDQVTAMLAGKTTWKGVWDLQVDDGASDPWTLAAGKFAAEMDITR